MFFFLFFMIFECNFDESFYGTDGFLSLLVREVFEHGERLHFLYSKVVFPCYIFFIDVFHGDVLK